MERRVVPGGQSGSSENTRGDPVQVDLDLVLLTSIVIVVLRVVRSRVTLLVRHGQEGRGLVVLQEMGLREIRLGSFSRPALLLCPRPRRLPKRRPSIPPF